MESKYVLIGVGVIILLIGGYLFFNSGAVVSAQGTSELNVQPDEVSVYLNIQTKATTAVDAKNNNSEINDKVLFALIKEGFERKDIQTLDYNIYPEYNYRAYPYQIVGYVANQQLLVKTSDFDKVAEIVDSSVDAGAIVQSINFELSQDKQNEYKAEALKLAAEDAETKASSIAEGFGKKLGKLVSTSNNEFYYGGPYRYYSTSSGDSTASSVAEVKSVAVNIAPREMQVTASVNVQYKLSMF